MLPSKKKEETTAELPDNTYISNAYGYVSSLFTPALPDCKEATQTRGLLSQYKHKATSLVRSMWRLNNTLHLLSNYQTHLEEFSAELHIKIIVAALRRYAAIVKKLNTTGLFLAEDEKSMLLVDKEIVGDFISRNRIDNDPSDAECVKLKGIIRKIEASRDNTTIFSHEIAIAIFDYVIYSNLTHLRVYYHPFIEWEIRSC